MIHTIKYWPISKDLQHSWKHTIFENLILTYRSIDKLLWEWHLITCCQPHVLSKNVSLKLNQNLLCKNCPLTELPLAIHISMWIFHLWGVVAGPSCWFKALEICNRNKPYIFTNLIYNMHTAIYTPDFSTKCLTVNVISEHPLSL